MTRSVLSCCYVLLVTAGVPLPACATPTDKTCIYTACYGMARGRWTQSASRLISCESVDAAKRESTKVWCDDDGMMSATQVYRNGLHGEVLSAIGFDSLGRLTSNETCEYAKGLLLRRRVRQLYPESPGETPAITDTSYHYSSGGLLRLQVELLNTLGPRHGSRLRVWSRTLYRHDGHGRLTEEACRSASGLLWYRRTRSYPVAGKLVERSWCNATGRPWTTIYYSDSQGRPLRVTILDGSGRMVSTERVWYHLTGLESERVIRWGSGKVKQRSWYVYEFDDFHRWTRKTIYTSVANGLSVSLRPERMVTRSFDVPASQTGGDTGVGALQIRSGALSTVPNQRVGIASRRE